MSGVAMACVVAGLSVAIVMVIYASGAPLLAAFGEHAGLAAQAASGRLGS
ncbi:MAG: hypothetical protein MUC44_02780 [Beijerinckiaceae bacterium]|nr:hypothetical protein [Beijerinckiaceae bacterium]